MTDHEIELIEREIRARKEHDYSGKIRIVSILLGCFAGALGALLAQWVINTFLI